MKELFKISNRTTALNRESGKVFNINTNIIKNIQTNSGKYPLESDKDYFILVDAKNRVVEISTSNENPYDSFSAIDINLLGESGYVDIDQIDDTLIMIDCILSFNNEKEFSNKRFL